MDRRNRNLGRLNRVRSLGTSGRHLLLLSVSQFDPERTSPFLQHWCEFKNYAEACFPRGEALCQPAIDDDESSERVGPPPAEQGIEADANQHSTGQCGINQGDTGLRSKHDLSSWRPVTNFPHANTSIT